MNTLSEVAYTQETASTGVEINVLKHDVAKSIGPAIEVYL